MELNNQNSENRLKFNSKYLPEELKLNSAEYFSRRIAEYKIWSTGNGELLRQFYSQDNGGADHGSGNYFWRKASCGTRMLHCGVPGLISSRMADILFGNGVNARVAVNSGDGESLKEDEQSEKLADGFLEELIKKLNLQANLQTAATNESWGGRCFFKLSHDLSVSPYPILETFDITQAEVVKTRGVTKAIIFKRSYGHSDQKYRLDEIYSTDANGDASISYKLFLLDGEKEDEVDLLAIPQTAKLFNINGRGAENGLHLDENQTFAYQGLKGMLAFEKSNRIPSLEFPGSDYGASDYEGLLGAFDALDEIFSGNMQELRTNKTRRYIPETLIQRDSETGEALPFDDFADSFVKAKEYGEDAENEIKVAQFADKTSSFTEKWKAALATVCNKVKISPSALGVTWLEELNPSANGLTLEMRASKLRLWKPLLEEMLLKALRLCVWMEEHANADTDGIADLKLALDNAAVMVDFGEYASPQDIMGGNED